MIRHDAIVNVITQALAAHIKECCDESFQRGAEVERLRANLGAARDVALPATTAAVRDQAKMRWKASLDAATIRAEAAESTAAGLRQALEAWVWVERTGHAPEGHGQDWQAYGANGYGEGPTPLAAVLDAMEKEQKG